MTVLQDINEQRELLNYEYSHLYNMVLYKGVKLNSVVSDRETTEGPEYGVITRTETGKRIRKFSSLERCELEVQLHGGQIVRLGRNHPYRTADILYTSEPLNEPMGSIYADMDESGNLERKPNPVQVDRQIAHVISRELIELGYPKGSHPTSIVLRDLHMRYNDIVPGDFAAAVVKHCNMPPSYAYSEGKIKSEAAARSFKSPEEKNKWYDTPAGKAWVKEHPVPSIFNLPTPEYIHRRG